MVLPLVASADLLQVDLDRSLSMPKPIRVSLERPLFAWLGTTGSLLIVEHDLAGASDEIIAESGGPIFTSGHDVFHWLRFDQASLREFDAVLQRGGSGHPLNAFVLGAGGPTEFGPKEEINSNSLQRLADRVRSVAVSAFDNEMLIVWTPDES